ncbi:MAG: COX15/CtaA family protein [Caulobacteraceae bacterium]|nr:COX15/CtaA family protein [Caulobacteraceae bacterium]
MVLAMVVVGGATRLTGSGLSITVWKPITGIIPPLNSAAWADAFARYRHSSQYWLINQGITLDQFKVLFWWEWGHRLLGRTIGLVFAAPFIAFVTTRSLPRRLLGRCIALFALGGLQGLVGWWMVESGLEGRASVEPERLATHLGVALVLFSALVWTALEAWNGEARARRSDGWSLAGAIFAAAVFFQCLMGALVAGNHAGLIDGDWPLMAGRWFPEDYWQGGVWATFAHGLAAVQFNHRIVAYAVLAGAAALAIAAARSGRTPTAIRLLALAALVDACAQGALGIASLWLSVPLAVALAHQANAVILLAIAVSLLWRARRV